ncbi:uncharacterized protein PFL1_04902 [Pseudozyma flocculosa PF-1]|uniref:protein-histidine N-methyltransferase n=2 Tax=Pseudozyma flocculosa TaxID=84751 RepID=A0A5C3EVZ1_9BASI|nr:uncharacterized protein PFL1_04902 [Pseudozyma flocculosa PF-1]EPQ27363.1 hypothetical protein PFL1_04902 [Pseudozyma flocculosa PF-1]SPO36222.1 related to HPM1 - AdoMet-dependent methyltransferase [Pseudozyma flocculosa]
MSFAFEFDDSEIDEEYQAFSAPSTSSPTAQPPSLASTSKPTAAPQAPFKQWPLHHLIDSLPSRISYSPITIHLDPRNAQNRQATLMRRDLFDARFQMLLDQQDDHDLEHEHDHDDGHGGTRPSPPAQTQQEEQENKAVAGVDSDLVPGVYEGGLKTWECALDLVATLDQRCTPTSPAETRPDWGWLRGKSILELGCGTAIPSVFLLQQLLNLEPAPSPSSSPSSSPSAPTALHLCDYNLQVLRLVTLPNLILAWYFSAASHAYRTSAQTLEARHEETRQLKSRGQDHFDTAARAEASSASAEGAGPGELSLDDSLCDAFQKSLDERNISLRFYSGSWQGLQPEEILADAAGASSAKEQASTASRGYFDLILSAETIYSLDTLPLFTDVLRRCCKPSAPPTLSGLDERLARSSLAQAHESASTTGPGTASAAETAKDDGPTTLCLVGAKVLYFGVGGGVESFKQQMQTPPPGSRKGWTETVRTVSQGVGRVVLSVGILPGA